MACLWRGLFGYILTSDPNSNPNEDSERNKTTRGNMYREVYSGPLYLVRCLILTPCSIYFYSDQITKHLYRQWKFCDAFAKQTQEKYRRVNRNPRSSSLLVLEPSVSRRGCERKLELLHRVRTWILLNRHLHFFSSPRCGAVDSHFYGV